MWITGPFTAAGKKLVCCSKEGLKLEEESEEEKKAKEEKKVGGRRVRVGPLHSCVICPSPSDHTSCPTDQPYV